MTRPGSFILLFVVVSVFFSVAFATEKNHKYEGGEAVTVWVDRVGPFANPQKFYMYNSLPFCMPDSKVTKFEGLGEAIVGHELVQSPISLSFGVPTQTGILCNKRLTLGEAEVFHHAVKHEYWYQLFIDDIPLWGMVGEVVVVGETYAHYIFTHLHFEVQKNGDQIVSATLSSENPVLLQEGAEISFTYSVSWKNSQVKFSERFDYLLDSEFFEHEVHWFSVFNSVMLLLFLTGVVGLIVVRTVRKEYVLGEDDHDDDIDDAGWKLLHRDVFRTPSNLVTLSSLIGAGFQLTSTVVTVLLLGSLGAKYYESRGSIITAFIIWFSLSSLLGGYFSGSIYAKNKGSKWIRTSFTSVSMFPLLYLSITFFTNLVSKSHGSLSYVPFGIMILLSLIFLIICVPLSLVGTFFGRHLGRSALQNQVGGVNAVPRMIPRKSFIQRTWVLLMWSGIIPFSILDVEFYYVFSSLFYYKYYYVYGMASIVFATFLFVTMATNIIVIFFQLNGEDHKWHWTPFRIALSTGLYSFGYGAYYYFFRSHMTGFVQMIHYFSINIFLAAGITMICTSVGFFAANLFVNKIYRGLKFD